jgi:hypothetical protein
VNNPSSLLQRLLLPVVESDVVNVDEALQSVAPAKEAPASGKGLPPALAWQSSLPGSTATCPPAVRVTCMMIEQSRNLNHAVHC